MAKKIIFSIVALFLLLAIPITFFVVKQQKDIRDKAAPASTINFSPQTKTVNVNDTFSLDIVLDTAENIVVMTRIDLIYDATKLKALNLKNSDAFPNFLTEADTSEPGKASVTLSTASISQPFHGRGTVATVEFQALQASTTPISIQFSEETYAGGLGETTNVLIGKPPASLTIAESGTQQPTPTSTPIVSGTPTPSLQITPTPSTTSAQLTITSPIGGGTTIQDPPVFSGKAPPGTAITLTISPGSTTGAVTTAANGTWTFTPPSVLGAGEYTATITSTNIVTGVSQNLTSTFTITTTQATTPTQINSPSPTQETQIPVTGGITLTYVILGTALFFIIGGFLIFTV